MCPKQEEFFTLIQQYARVIVSAIQRVCGARYPSLQPDVEQEVYLVLWQRLQTGVHIEYPSSYLYKVALRTALAVLRDYTSQEIDMASQDRQSQVKRYTSGGEDSDAEQVCWLTELLAHLPAEQERAVRAYLAGFNHTEVAALYGWSPTVARHRIYRGLQALRDFARQEAA